MDKGKRDFIKIAGLTAVGGAVGVTAVRAIAEKPGPAKKTLAMVIDTTVCKGDCPDCMAQCHKVHNVPHGSNPNCKGAPPDKQAMHWLWTETFGGAFHEQVHARTGKRNNPVLVLCNHCDNPPCVRVCPTKATWKRASDGIVTIDMHRCIGCRFCMAGCPYGSRSFNYSDPRKYFRTVEKDYPTRTLGVVEKCNFCVERLALGQNPACVDACEKTSQITGGKAMAFGDLMDPNSPASRALKKARYTIRRKPTLGTGPEVYYIV